MASRHADTLSLTQLLDAYVDGDLDIHDLLEEISMLRAERGVARKVRADLTQSVNNLESELYRVRAELEAAHAKNLVLLNRFLSASR